MNFDQMNLHPAILKAISLVGYSQPTPVQAQTIPQALQGTDILASAQTGTGKTAAFILPALQLLSIASKVTDSKGPRVLVLAPTRELAMQVTKAARDYSKFLNRVNVVSITGGVSYQQQRSQMNRAVEIMVATPGRLIDYIHSGKIDFRRIEMFILDEADRMLDLGFRDDVHEIHKALPKPHQTLLFSATIDGSIAVLAKDLLKQPIRIEVSQQKEKHADIEQQLYYLQDMAQKRRLLLKLLEDSEVKQALIFTATKLGADELTQELGAKGIQAEALHGDMRQRERSQTIRMFREGKLRVIVATDVAARGINVLGISHVINFDVPRGPQDYVHRIGRTGRAGAKGKAVLMVYPKERRQVAAIEKFTGHSIKVLSMPGFEVKMLSEEKRRKFGRQSSRHQRQSQSESRERPRTSQRNGTWGKAERYSSQEHSLDRVKKKHRSPSYANTEKAQHKQKGHKARSQQEKKHRHSRQRIAPRAD